MKLAEKRAFVVGIPLGLAIGLGFALFISLIPESAFTESLPRTLLYAGQVIAGALFALVFRPLARLGRWDPYGLLNGAAAGAMLFDGLALGFWPSLYGHEGPALTYVAATLLWAFAWILIANQMINRRPT